MSQSSRVRGMGIRQEVGMASLRSLIIAYRDPLRWWGGVLALVFVGMVAATIYRAAVSRAYRPSAIELNLTVVRSEEDAGASKS